MSITIQQLAKEYHLTESLISQALGFTNMPEFTKFIKGIFSLHDDSKARILAEKLIELNNSLKNQTKELYGR